MILPNHPTLLRKLFFIAAPLLLILLYSLRPTMLEEKKIIQLERVIQETRLAYQTLPQENSSKVLEKQLFTDLAGAFPQLKDWLKHDQGSNWKDYFKHKEAAEEDKVLINKVIQEINEYGGKTRDLRRELRSSELEESALIRLYLRACERRSQIQSKQIISATSDKL